MNLERLRQVRFSTTFLICRRLKQSKSEPVSAYVYRNDLGSNSLGLFNLRICVFIVFCFYLR